MADLELLFATRVELEGAKAYADALERNIGKMKAAGKDASELTAQHTKLTESIKESEKVLGTEATASDKNTEATKTLGEQKKSLTKSLQGLAFELPGVGRLMGFLQNQATAGAAGIGLLVGVLQRWRQRLDELSDAQVKVKVLEDGVASLNRQTAEFRNSADNFEDGLEKIKTAGTDAADTMKRLNEEIERNRMLQDMLVDKGMALEKQRNREFEQKGLITARERIQRDVEAENNAERNKAARELEALDRQIGQAHFAEAKTKRELESARGQDLDPATLAQQKREAETAAKRAGKSQEDFDKFDDDQRKKIAGLADARAGLSDKGVLGTLAGLASVAADLPPADYDAQIKALEDELDLQKRLNEDQQRAADAARRSFEEAQSTQTEARAKITEASQRLKALETERKQLESERKAKGAFAAKALPIDEATRKSAADTELNQLDREKAEKDAQFWFKIYQQAEGMSPEQRKKFLNFDPPARKPTPAAYGSDRAMESGAHSQGYNATVAMTSYKEEMARSRADTAARLKELLDGYKSYNEAVTSEIKKHDRDIKQLESRLNARR